jgi:uncharacterized repeat protein (TIGR03803 family)
MKTYIKKLFLLPALIAALGLMPAGRATAQTFTTLHSFTAIDPNTGTNSDGANPEAGLILSGNTLYGTASAGGTNGNGTIFAVNTDGTGFTNLYSFTATSGFFSPNSDGANPLAGLILSGNTLYGTASAGGSSANGTVFAVNTDGMSFTNLYSFTATRVSFTNSDGASPEAGLILSGNTLYGTAAGGGRGGVEGGTVFRVNTDSTDFTNLHSFTYSDGTDPVAGLILSGNTLYGTAQQDGSSGGGTVFAVNTDGTGTNGTGFTNLYSFTALSGSNYTNSDGIYPVAGLILSGNTLYGTASGGGSWDAGTVFAFNTVNTNGMGFTNLYNFTGLAYNSSFIYTNSAGIHPLAGLILSGNTLYGTANSGGKNGTGTVFAINTNGTGFKTLYSFTAVDQTYSTNSDGAYPDGGLILSGNTLYGTTSQGGSSGYGTVFSLSFGTPQLAINRSGTNVVLTWPTNATGFTLQSTTNLVSTTVWSNVAPAAVVVNTNNAVTNAISGTKKFYRLSQ